MPVARFEMLWLSGYKGAGVVEGVGSCTTNWWAWLLVDVPI